MRRSRRLVLSAAAMGLALAASGCAYMSPVQTHVFYDAADGVNATITQEGLQFAGIRNAVLVFAEDGTAMFSATVVNYSDEEITTTVEGFGENGDSIFSADVTVPAGETVELGPGEEQQTVQVDPLDVIPGVILEYEFTAGGFATTASLPTVDSSLEYFEEMDPASTTGA